MWGKCIHNSPMCVVNSSPWQIEYARKNMDNRVYDTLMSSLVQKRKTSSSGQENNDHKTTEVRQAFTLALNPQLRSPRWQTETI